MKRAAHKSKTNRSEVNAYRFIYDELTTKKGWKKDQVYEQQECLEIKGIKQSLGTLKPENVVAIDTTRYYIVEAKNERKKLEQAIKEATEYSDLINSKSDLRAIFATGVAGNDAEGFVAKSAYLKGGKWETITENDIELTSLLSKNQVELILNTKTAKIKDVEISSEEFFKVAGEINTILHDNSINKDYRARFISAILLALSDDTEINLNERNASVLISLINAKVAAILNKHNKAAFSRFIRIDDPSSEDNHIKVRAAIIRTIQELLGLNIRSAMRSGRDILGQFYEVFLKYGNGAKEIGIVLTPRHITSFAAEVLDIRSNDLVLDPACGTGGFLVAAFDEARKKIKSKVEFDNFRENGLYGIEEQDPVIALAIVNMIFRGDGKNNMIEGNCFNKWLTLKTSGGVMTAEYRGEDFQGRIPPITKVMMNPPFAQKSSKSKEYQFINQALMQMQNEGILFSVLPLSVLIEKATADWRKDLLKHNTLLSVVTFPEDLFYPTGTHTLGIFIKKGIPHKKDSPALWIRALNDGFVKKKGKRVKSERAKDDISEIKELLKSFIKDQSIKVKNKPQLQKKALIDFADESFELIPELYVDDKELSQEEIEFSMESLMRETASFLIRTKEK